jgi:hypothetical protein
LAAAQVQEEHGGGGGGGGGGALEPWWDWPWTYNPEEHDQSLLWTSQVTMCKWVASSMVCWGSHSLSLCLCLCLSLSQQFISFL